MLDWPYDVAFVSGLMGIGAPFFEPVGELISAKVSGVVSPA